MQLLCTPAAHIGGTVATLVLAAGGRVVLQPTFEPGQVLAAIQRERVTLIQLLPRLLHRLLDHPDLPTTDTSSLQTLRIGSAPASPARISEAVTRFGPILGQTYGSIEATNITTLSPQEMARPELQHTVGHPAPGVELSLRDQAANEVPDGEVGEVWVRGPAVMRGYYNAPEQTAAVMRQGWFRTGDLGRLDDAGYLTLVGRSKDVIFAEHARIYPVEIEQTLLAHSEVAAAGVFAATLWAQLGARPRHHCGNCGLGAVAVGLLAWVRERRGANVVPSRIHIVAELPTTPTAKLDRLELQRQLAGTISAAS